MQLRTERSENDVVFNTCVLLNTSGFYAWRNNTVGVYDQAKGVYRKGDAFSITGVSDVIAIRNGVTYFIECKFGKGSQKDSQRAFEKQLKKHGVCYLVVYSSEEVREWIKQFKQTQNKEQLSGIGKDRKESVAQK